MDNQPDITITVPRQLKTAQYSVTAMVAFMVGIEVWRVRMVGPGGSFSLLMPACLALMVVGVIIIFLGYRRFRIEVWGREIRIRNLRGQSVINLDDVTKIERRTVRKAEIVRLYVDNKKVMGIDVNWPNYDAFVAHLAKERPDLT